MSAATVVLPSGCDLCGHPSATVVYAPSKENSAVTGAFTPTADDMGIYRDILRCGKCGLWLSVPPPETQLIQTYNDADGGHARYVSEESGRVRTAERILDFISGALPKDTETPRHLDIGAWSGLLVSRAAARGWRSTGVEPNAAAVEAGRAAYKIHLLHGDVMNLALEDASFDVITLAESIEHFHSPRAALARVSRLLKPGGVLYVSTPNAGGLISRLTGRRWPGFRMMHYFFFDPRTLGTLLEESGFAVCKRRPLRKNFSVGYILSTALKRPIRLPFVSSWTVPIWAGDMELIARKK